MSREFRSSPSQISMYELCPRKWAWKYVDGLKPPPNKWARFGTEVHSVLEYWFRKRTPPNTNTRAGKVAQAMIPHLPPPQQIHPDDVELRVDDLVLGGVPFLMFIDLFARVEGVPHVYDHKTSGNLIYALAEEDMHQDIQATTYGYWGMVKTNSQHVRVQWTYGTTKGKPRGIPRSRVLTLDEIKPRLERTAQSAHETKLIKLSGCEARDVPYDAAGCEAFGGCPFQEQCGLTPAERIESVMSDGVQKNDFLAKLNARKAAMSGGNGAATHPPAINPEPAAPTASAPGINPPEPPAPPAAPSTPAAEPSKPAKKTRKKRKTKAEKEAEAAAAAQAAQSASESPAPPPVQPPPAPEIGAHAGVGSPGAANMLQVLNAQYRAGFQDGFNAGLKHRG